MGYWAQLFIEDINARGGGKHTGLAQTLGYFQSYALGVSRACALVVVLQLVPPYSCQPYHHRHHPAYAVQQGMVWQQPHDCCEPLTVGMTRFKPPLLNAVLRAGQQHSSVTCSGAAEHAVASTRGSRSRLPVRHPSNAHHGASGGDRPSPSTTAPAARLNMTPAHCCSCVSAELGAT
jgi:hypothetical protein